MKQTSVQKIIVCAQALQRPARLTRQPQALQQLARQTLQIVQVVGQEEALAAIQWYRNCVQI